MFNKESFLCHLPNELVMKTLLPYLDMESLNTLSKASIKWEETVNNYLDIFNRVIQTEVSLTNRLFFSSAKNATSLVKLELIWNTDLRSDNEFLDQILNANKSLTEIDLTTTDNGWISTEVVKTIATKLPKLLNVSFSSSRIRLYLDNGDSRKLWPHTCWGSRRVDDGSIDGHGQYTEEQVKYFKKLISNQAHLKPSSEENKVLNCLRTIQALCHFYDYSNASENSDGQVLLDPLVYHEHKCPKGLHYDAYLDSDIEEGYDFEEPLLWFVDSESDESD